VETIDRQEDDMSTLFRTCFYRTKCKYNLWRL